MVETFAGILVAVVLIVITLILVAIAFIYVGFALKDNTVPYIILEIVVAILFYFIALIGYLRNSSLVAFGIIGHGVWDILHHNAWVVNTAIPTYWPSFCLTIDLLYGIYLLYIFKKLPAWI
jgi:hypothetical protein